MGAQIDPSREILQQAFDPTQDRIVVGVCANEAQGFMESDYLLGGAQACMFERAKGFKLLLNRTGVAELET